MNKLLFCFLIISSLNAHSLEDENILNNALLSTVGIVSAEFGITPFCSGVLITRELVLTAAH